MKKIKLTSVEIVIILALGMIAIFMIHYVQDHGFQYVNQMTSDQ